MLLLPLALASCGDAPQVISVIPGRGSGGIHSNAPVEVTFSTAMNKQSVEDHFSVQPVAASLFSIPWLSHQPLGPPVKGSFSWPTPRTMRFNHEVLLPGTHYQVVLEGGFQGAQGGVNTLRHSWIFETDLAPEMTGSSPADGATQVGIDSYLNVSFGYQVLAQSLQPGAITLSPDTPVTLHRDPTDPYNVIIAPHRLLKPFTTYRIHVTRQVRNTDGNRIGHARTITFHTGKSQLLQTWITFVGPSSPRAQGVWLVQARPDLPRPLLRGSYTQARWSESGRELLVQRSNGTWAEADLDGRLRDLPFSAQWASFVGAQLPGANPPQTFAYLEHSTLRVQRFVPGDKTQPAPVTVATNVGSAAVRPGGSAIAYTVHTATGWEVRGYTVGLGAAYQLTTARTPIDDLSWSPAGTQLAYRVEEEPAATSSVVAPGPAYRLQTITLGSGSAPVTVAVGQVGNPAWETDDRTLLFTDQLPGQTTTRIFRAVVGQSPTRPAPGTGLPTGPHADIQSFEISPDGRQIAYLTQHGGGQILWLMNADGTGTRQLTGAAGSVFPWTASGLSWSPFVTS
ncbi:MAG: Ig-like domain-containing protein [Candidatus Dormibacteraeota bacterium]|nr:Ig-like domain-containing protein [Candidatus Dormibacteraeota bacterium]